jgi:hypothetical protein
MTIETKFKPRDKAWFMCGNKISEMKIYKITIFIEDSNTIISNPNIKVMNIGTVNGYGSYSEYDEDLYTTKEECALAWVKKQGLNIDPNGTLINDKQDKQK